MRYESVGPGPWRPVVLMAPGPARVRPPHGGPAPCPSREENRGGDDILYSPVPNNLHSHRTIVSFTISIGKLEDQGKWQQQSPI
jgi:hypothetical protein